MANSNAPGKLRDGTVRVGTVTVIPELLRRLGVDPSDVLAAAKLDPAVFDDPDNTISYSARNRLVELCADRTGCHHFGLLIGQHTGLSALGLVGYLVLHSADVGSALRSLVHYFRLHAQGASVALIESGSSALLSYSILRPGVDGSAQIQDGAVAIVFNALQSLCGSDWQPTEVRFIHRPPADIEPFRRYFGAPLRFNTGESGILFAKEWLSKPVRDADPELHRLLQKQVQALAAAHEDTFPAQVRRVLGTAILTGRSSEEEVAALFSMNERTLRRRLRSCGSTFREVADSVRFEIAQHMLTSTALKLAYIALALGYADHSAFSRAFKRWSGLTPSQWRQANQ